MAERIVAVARMTRGTDGIHGTRACRTTGGDGITVGGALMEYTAPVPAGQQEGDGITVGGALMEYTEPEPAGQQEGDGITLLKLIIILIIILQKLN